VLVLNICVLRKIRHAGHLQLSDTHSSSRKGKRRSTTNSLYNRIHGNGEAAGAHLNVMRSSSSVSANGLVNVASSNVSTSGGSHNFTTTTITLLWVSFYLIFTTLPITMVFAIQTAIPLGDTMPLPDMAHDPTWRRYFAYYTTRIILREIGMSHHVGNVFIYLATSNRFRRQLKKRLLRGGPMTPCAPPPGHGHDGRAHAQPGTPP
jgi:hypothetical protein